jgi:hypothetical protein
MSSKRLLPVIGGSILGAIAIHLALVGCSDPTRSAQAADCASYQVASFYKASVITRPAQGDWTEGLSPPIDLPAGWEPLTAAPYGGSSNDIGAMVMLRRCAE